MVIDARALDGADPPVLARAADELALATPRLRDAAVDLVELAERTAGGWTGRGHAAWDAKVRDIAGRVAVAAAALDDLERAVAAAAGAAADGQAQLRAAAATAVTFGASVSPAQVAWAATRSHYDGVLLEAGRLFDAVAGQAPAAPSLPVVCPPPPPPPKRPWWDDLLFGMPPVVLDEHCQPIRQLEGGTVPKSMLRLVRQIGRADKLDEPIEILRGRVVTSRSWPHLAEKHTKKWFGTEVATKAMKEAFEEVVIKGLRSSKVYNGNVPTDAGLVPTLNHLYSDGSKRLLVQVHLEGTNAGLVAAVRIPSQRQLTAALRAWRAVR